MAITELSLNNIETISRSCQNITEEVVPLFVNNPGSIAVVFGTMCSGKSTTVAGITRSALNSGVETTVFKLRHDVRKDEGNNKLFYRSATGPSEYLRAIPINNIVEAIPYLEEMPEGSIAASVEAPFMGSIENLAKYITAAKERNISMLFDGLGAWHFGGIIPQMQYLVERSNYASLLRAFCEFDQTHKAEYSSRFTKISKYEEILKDAKYYSKTGSLNLKQRVRDLRNSIYGSFLSNSIDESFYLPSDSSDEKIVIGDEQYKPLCHTHYTEICALAGITLPAGSKPISEHYNSDKVKVM